MQAENILRTQDMLEDRIKILSGTKQRKNTVLKEQDKEMSQLKSNRKKKK